MNAHRLSIHLLLGGMLAAALLVPLQRRLEASSSLASGFNQSLLLRVPALSPRLDRLARLDRLVITNYVVGRNEDLWAICRRYNLDQFAVKSSNDLEENPVPGTLLRIPNRRGTLYTVKTPESLHAIASGFEVGRKGGLAYEREVLETNDFPKPSFQDKSLLFPSGTELFLPNAYKPTGLGIPFELGAKYRTTSSFGSRRHPVLGVVRRHKGLDLARPYGSPVTVAREGVVTFAGWMGGYGNMIEIRHKLRNGRTQYTRYGHLSKILVHEGQRVRLYQLIGRVGSTGISTGPHLHYEVRNEAGVATNPAKFQ